MKYFSYDPNGGGFLLHATEDEARKEAEIALEEDRKNAVDDGWSEQVTRICWGEVRQNIAVTSRQPSENPNFSEAVDYDLVDA